MENKDKEQEKIKEDELDFKEEIVILDRPLIVRNQPRKLNSKIIAKKTILGKAGLKSVPSYSNTKPKKSNAEFLIETIVKTYWTKKWKEQIIIQKFSRTGFNRKRGDFRGLCMKLNHSMKYHQYLYLAKLFDNMEKLPMKEGVKHDDFFGKIKLVSSKLKLENAKEEKVNIENDNVILDDNGKIEIKIDIPQIKEVEYKPEEDLEKEIKIEKENENKKDNILIDDIIKIKPESQPKLINLNKKKKIIKNKDDINNKKEEEKNKKDEDNKNKEEDKNKKEEGKNKKEEDKSNNFINSFSNIINKISKESKNNQNTNEDKDEDKNKMKEEIIEPEPTIPIKIEEKEKKKEKEEKKENNNNELTLLNNILNDKSDFKGNINYNNNNIKKENEENKKEEIIDINNQNEKEKEKGKVNNLIQIQIQPPKISEIKVEKDINIINEPKKEIKTDIKDETEKIKMPEIIINKINDKVNVKKESKLAKKIKRLKENYLDKENIEKKRKSASIIVKREKGLGIQEDDDDISDKINKIRKMSDFYNDYDKERISKSKRLQYKLKKIKDNED